MAPTVLASSRAFFFSSQEGTDTPGGMSDGEITATLICPADMDRLISMFLSQQVLSLHTVIGRPKKKKRETDTDAEAVFTREAHPCLAACSHSSVTTISAW